MRKSVMTFFGLTLVTVACLGSGCPTDLLDAIDCMDPAVATVEVEVLEKDGSTGRIRITGTVINVGLQTFDSSEGQQAVELVESNTVVATTTFVDLETAEEVTVTYETAWNSASEFLPDYTVRLSYDPDIFIDGNEENDDCRTANNSRTLTAAEINEVFNAADDT